MTQAVRSHQETDNLDKYSRTTGVEGALMTRFRRRLVSEAAGLRPTSALDAGCGEGAATEWLAAALPDAELSGVDSRCEALAQASGRLPQATFRESDLYSLPWRDNHFDLVICTEVLEHLERPEDGVAELVRVSRSHLLLTVPHEPFFRAGNLARGRYRSRLGSTPGHLNTWGALGFRRLVGRSARQVRWFDLFPWQGLVARV